MTATLASPIKTAIEKDLYALKTAGVLGDVYVSDLSKDPFAGTYPKYPVAILGMSSIESDASDNMDNLRTYVFPILVLNRVENIDAATDMEDLRDAILNKFDTDYTLGGNAIGAVLPNSSIAYTASTPDKSLAYFIITLKAKALYRLGT